MKKTLDLQDEATFAIHEQRLGNDVEYLRDLVAQNPGTLKFNTGAGHILFDLIKHLPSIAGREQQKIELCQRITDTVYPLAASLSAQAVTFVLTISPDPIAAPASIGALATYAALNEATGIMRYCFLSPQHVMSGIAGLLIPAGLTVYCEPLNYHYHQMKEDRELLPRHAASNLPSHYWANRSSDSPLERGDREDESYKLGLAVQHEKFHNAATQETKMQHFTIQPVVGANGAVHTPGNYYYHQAFGPLLPISEPQ